MHWNGIVLHPITRTYKTQTSCTTGRLKGMLRTSKQRRRGTWRHVVVCLGAKHIFSIRRRVFGRGVLDVSGTRRLLYLAVCHLEGEGKTLSLSKCLPGGMHATQQRLVDASQAARLLYGGEWRGGNAAALRAKRQRQNVDMRWDFSPRLCSSGHVCLVVIGRPFTGPRNVTDP